MSPPVVVSVDKAGDLKFGRKKCRLHKKEEVVKVAKKYGIVNPEKLTVKEMCAGLKMRAANTPLARDLLRHAAKRGVRTNNLHLYTPNKNNVPLAKLYPEAAKKRAEKKAFNRKVAANFMKGMVTKRIATPTRTVVKAVMPMPKPKPMTKEIAKQRIMAMKGLTGRNKFVLVNRVNLNQHSPRRVVRLARELARLR